MTTEILTSHDKPKGGLNTFILGLPFREIFFFKVKRHIYVVEELG